MEKILINIFILNLIISIANNYIVIPFKISHQKEPDEFSSAMDILTYWDNNIIYSNTLIGTPPQNVTIFFHSQNFSSNLYYHMCDFPHSSFERKDSSTFSFVEKLNRIYPMENASLVSDKFYFYEDLNAQNKKQYILPFIYSDNEKEIQKDKYEYHDYTCMSIGLKMNYIVLHEPKSNFISQLKKAGLLTFDFTFEYSNQDEGKIIIGEEPYSYEPSKYNKKKYKVSGAMNEKDKDDFFLNFDSIYMMGQNDQREELESKNIKFIIDMGLILGPEDYRKKIKELFFDKFIENKKCYEEYIDRNYIYWCDISAENEVKSNFPTLFLYMKQYFKTFEFTYYDLFKKKNNKLYFLVHFKNDYYNTNDFFEIGKIFLQKYTLTFNQYNRHIGYHNNEIKLDGEGEDEGQEKKSIWQNKILWIVLAILVVVFAILGVILGKKVREHVRKKRMNEVDDDNYVYAQPENEDQKLYKNEENNENINE